MKKLRRKLRRIMRTPIKVRNTRRRERAVTFVMALTILFHATYAYGALIHEMRNEPRLPDFVTRSAQAASHPAVTRTSPENAAETPLRSNAEVLQDFLAGKNAELAAHADYIVTLPRWVEAVAITHKETSYCNRGVAESRNNCAGIKNIRGEFKHYRTKLDSLEDLTILLQNARYKSLTIEAMNGIYCQDESRAARKCENWDRDIMRVVDDLNGKLSGV